MVIRTQIDPDGTSWVVIDDKDWAKAEMRDYVGGFPIFTRRP